MKIPVKVQQEIAEYIYLEELKNGQKVQYETDEKVKMMLKGINLGLSRAREIVNAWNESNHGKVQIQLNKNN